MASASSIARLHWERAPQPEREQINSAPRVELKPDVAPPPTERAIRTRFARGHQEVETGYTLDPSTIMGTMVPAAPPDRAGRLQALAERERLMRMARHLGARGSREFSAPPF